MKPSSGSEERKSELKETIDQLVREAMAWRREKDEEELEKRPKEKKAEAKVENQTQTQAQQPGEWSQLSLAQWMEKDQPDDGKKKEGGRRLNASDMSRIRLLAVRRERAIALGEELPDRQAMMLEREIAREKGGIELEVLVMINQEKGRTSSYTLARKLGYNPSLMNATCRSLGEADYIDYTASGMCVITLKGKEELIRKLTPWKEGF